MYPKEGEANSTLDQPSNICLPDGGMFTIRAYSSKPGFTMSSLTEKTVNCSFTDIVLGHIPLFSIGPAPSKAHWSQYGNLGTAMYRMHSFYTAPYVTFWFHLTLNMVRCAFTDRNLHSRMPLDPTHVRFKRTCV
jgi:hypothetical protein